MAFLELAKSVYQNQHKAKPIALTSVEEGKFVRIKKQAVERKQKRNDTFFSNRYMEGEDNIVLTPQGDVQAPRIDKEMDVRKKQMLQWKEERMKRKKMEPKKPPPFKVGVVKHHVAPLQDDIFKNPIKAKPVVQATCHRITRSTAKANIVPSLSNNQQSSFAPINAKFHAPNVAVSNKNAYLKYTPRRTRARADPLKLTAVLNNMQPNQRNNVNKAFNFNINTSKATNSKSTAITKVVRNIKRLSKGRISAGKGSKLKAIGATKKEKRLSGISKNKRLSGRRKNSRRSSRINSENELLDNNIIATSSKSVANECVPMITPTNKRLSKLRSDSLDVSVNNKSRGSLNNCSLEGQNKSEELVISSPFVTVARGKSGQRRETMCKMKLGYTQMSPEKTAQYFRLQLDGEIIRLQSLCEKWKDYQKHNGDLLQEESNDLINLAVGQTQLLISKKFQQFRGLVTRCESQEKKDGEGIVTPQDLQGFWDMVYMQVENVDIRFQKLDEVKAKDWKEDDALPSNKNKKVVAKVVKPSKANSKASSGLKAMIQAARMKTKVAEPMLPAMTPVLKPETVTFNGGFFSVVSPVKTTDDHEIKTSSRRGSMLKSVVDSEAKKRIPTKTPESAKAIMKASRFAKHVTNNGEIPEYMLAPVDLKKTPAKSILKTPAKTTTDSNFSSRKSLRVLFSDEESSDSNKKLFRVSVGDNPIVTLSEFKKSIPNDYIEEDLKSIYVSVPELVKSKKRGRLARQMAVVDDNDENTPPASNDDDPSDPVPVKIYNTRRRKSENENLMDEETVLEPSVVKPSRRSKRKSSIDDGVITFDMLAASTMSKGFSPAAKKARKKSVDRQSINLISFSPVKQSNSRYSLRRTNVS